MTVLPPPADAARVSCFLADHPRWSAYWDKKYGLWRVAEDDPDSDLYAESSDADTVIGYIVAHTERRGTSTTRPSADTNHGKVGDFTAVALGRCRRLCGRIFLLVSGWQGRGQRLDGTFELGQVVVDRALQNRMICVEVAVSQMVTHACDLRPGDIGLGTQHLGRQRLNGFADFQQPDTDGVGYQPVR